MQTHLKGFGLENFRVFKDYTWFDFAPITILTGPNSSGKSSLNKALMLMKDNFEKGHLPPYYTLVHEGFSSSEHSDFFQSSRLDPDMEREFIQEFEPSSIEFNGTVHGLNNPDSTICRSGSSNLLVFTVQYRIKNGRNLDFTEMQDYLETLNFKKPSLFYNKSLSDYRISEKKSKDLLKKIAQEKPEVFNSITTNLGHKDVKYRLSFEIANNKAKSLSKIEILNKHNLAILKITDTSVFFDVELFDEVALTEEIRLSEFFLDSKREIHSSTEIDLEYWFLQHGVTQEKSVELANIVLSNLGVTVNGQKLEVKTVTESLQKLDYLATNKNEYKRSYSEDEESSFKNTMKYLVEAKNKGFEFKEFFEDCSKAFGIDGVFDLKYDSEMGTYFPNIGGHSFVNFGYGYSQIASIIFKIAEHAAKKYFPTGNGGYSFDEKTTVMIIEEPESNLHPKYQSLLADLFVDTAQTFYIQFIIETHSEYLIRKLQYLTAKKQVKPSDSVIYYFHDPREKREAGVDQAKKIEILEDGSLSDDFGHGFFDEAANLELELIRLKNAKNRNN